MNRPAACSNCGIENVTHNEMYCELPQKFLRCLNEKCWAAAQNPAQHSHSCGIRERCQELSPEDEKHKQTIRVSLATERAAIKRFVTGSLDPVIGISGVRTQSTIAKQIEFGWSDEKIFEIIGPKTMNFRLLLAIERLIVARVDIGYRKTNITTFDAQPTVDRAHEVTTIHQTAAILSFEEDEKIDIETDTYVYHCQFKKQGQIYVLAGYHQILKDEY